MIIWLASYPKSGNTWLRAFITSLLSENITQNSLENMTGIRAYPLTDDFKNLLDDYKDFKKIAQNWETTQNIINLQKKIRFLKTHHILCNVENFPFTNYKNSLGAIYVVRDPRNIITSLLHHYSLENYENALEFLLDKHRFSGRLDRKENLERQTEFPTYISNWSNHYNAWKNFKKNFLLIKYENLVNNEENEFLKIRTYLEEKLNLKFSDNKFNTAVSSNSFLKLKKIEESEGFSENVSIDPNKKVNFFNLGPKNDYKNLLDKKISKEIENLFYPEMKELGYI